MNWGYVCDVITVDVSVTSITLSIIIQIGLVWIWNEDTVVVGIQDSISILICRINAPISSIIRTLVIIIYLVGWN